MLYVCFGIKVSGIDRRHTHLSCISMRHIKGSRAKSDSSVLNCRGNNSNFRVVQVETV